MTKPKTQAGKKRTKYVVTMVVDLPEPATKAAVRECINARMEDRLMSSAAVIAFLYGKFRIRAIDLD